MYQIVYEWAKKISIPETTVYCANYGFVNAIQVIDGEYPKFSFQLEKERMKDKFHFRLNQPKNFGTIKDKKKHPWNSNEIHLRKSRVIERRRQQIAKRTKLTMKIC